MTTVVFCLCAAFGGAARFVCEFYWPPVGHSAFPRATLVVNVVGSFILGTVAYAPSDAKLWIGTGLCGALTTFSGVSVQLYRRAVGRAWWQMSQYLASLLALGLVAARVGIEVSSWLFR